MTALKPTVELIEELRGHCADMVSLGGRARKGILESADRLETILKAWEACVSERPVTVAQTPEFVQLRIAITGIPTGGA